MPPPRKKSEYKKSWEEDARFKEWVRPVKSDIHSFWCLCCEKKLSLSTMYEHSLTDHLENERHGTKLVLWRKNKRDSTQFFAPKAKAAHPPLAAATNDIERLREEKASEQGDRVSGGEETGGL